MTDYLRYILSPRWHARSEAAKARAGHRCQVCNADRWFCALEVHHRTYERLGRERDDDLIVLCRHCHELFHRFGKFPPH